MSFLKNNISKLDDKDFKNIIHNRQEYIESGDYSFKSSITSLDKLAAQRTLEKETFIIRKKEVQDNTTLITLSPKSARNIPLHRPGEYLVLSTYIAGNFYSRPYYVLKSNNNENSEYLISVLKKEDGIVSDYLRNIKEKSEVTISGLYGNTCFNDIRDGRNIIVICTNYGINAVYSYVNWIIKEGIKIKINIIYSVKKYSDILYLKELRDLANKSSRVFLEIVISDEIVDGYETGFVTKKTVKKYLTEDTTIYIYGEEGILKNLKKELEDLKLPRKYIRYEDYLPRCNIRNSKKFQLIIKYNDKEYKQSCYNDKTLLYSIENSSLPIDSISRTGKDNCCNVKLLIGKVKVINDIRNSSEKALNMLDPANTYPNSDVKIEIS